MGAEPRAAVISVAAPGATPASWLERFYDGAAELAGREGLALVGGDVVGSPAYLFFAMAILGRVPAGTALTRGGASPGDLLFLSGEMGLAQAGLHVLSGEGECRPAAAEAATRRYRRPVPRVALGRALRGGNLATAAIDTSDSLGESLAHLTRASAVGVTVEAEALPITEAARDVAASRGEDAVAYALAAGEDFELLFACPPARAAAAARAAAELGLSLHKIGLITEPERGVLLAAGGAERPLEPAGFAHF
jgi:thiamine-monophosphate kinase